jgi:hypothetical protein
MKLSPMTRGKIRKPLITFKELATEFGVTMAELRGYMSNYGAPKPEMVTHTAHYYEPIGIRKWWKGVGK